MEKCLAVNVFFYCVLGLSLYLVCEGSFRALLRAFKMQFRLRKREDDNAKSSLVRRADLLVKASIGFENSGNKLLIALAVISAATLVTVKPYMGIGGTALMSIMAGSVPVIFLRLKLAGKRNAGSAEGEAFIAELITSYKLAGCRIDRGLESIVHGENDKGIKICRRLCEDVLSKMREAGNSEKLVDCAEGLAYGIGTKWAELTSFAIGMAAADGTDISASLEDVMMQLREARILAEERRRLNGEAVRIVMFMVPIAYLLTMFFSVRILGIGLRDILRNQFCTTAGLVLLFGIVFVFIVNMLLLSIVRHMQFDF